ncbi:MAG: glycerophosphodiester phosphodiesterase [Actinobacteria bacterium]|nr:glycerophosphodiester phosphodiesterase [Actinomycetota bacterium]
MVAPDFPSHDLPLVLAHRGLSARHPENTLPAFAAAIEVGAHGIELDVRLSSDGVPVVIHDADVARTTGGRGLVNELPLGELRRLDASGDGSGPVRIPTLREVLELASGRIGVDLEIKNVPGDPAFDSPREAVLEATLGELEAVGFPGPVLISSFNPGTVERSRELSPGVPTGLLTPAPVDPLAALDHAARMGHRFVLPAASALLGAGAGFVEEAHGRGVRVGTWTVDDPDTLAVLFGWGVDAVACNDPEVGLAVRREVLSG